MRNLHCVPKRQLGTVQQKEVQHLCLAWVWPESDTGSGKKERPLPSSQHLCPPRGYCQGPSSCPSVVSERPEVLMVGREAASRCLVSISSSSYVASGWPYWCRAGRAGCCGVFTRKGRSRAGRQKQTLTKTRQADSGGNAWEVSWENKIRDWGQRLHFVNFWERSGQRSSEVWPCALNGIPCGCPFKKLKI